MLQGKVSYRIISPYLLASVLVLLSTIFTVIYFQDISEEISFGFIASLISLSTFSLLNPVVLIFQRHSKEYFQASLLLFAFELIYMNFFSVGSYVKTLSYLSLDIEMLNILSSATFLFLSGLVLSAKRIKNKRSKIEILAGFGLENPGIKVVG